jgi:hypothetical protein
MTDFTEFVTSCKNQQFYAYFLLIRVVQWPNQQNLSKTGIFWNLLKYSMIFLESFSSILKSFSKWEAQGWGANVLANFKVQLLLHMKINKYFKDIHGSALKLRFQWAYSDQKVISYENVMAIWS